MLDVSVSYNRYKFLGCEYLTWLWFLIDEDPGVIGGTAEGPVSVKIGNRIVLENRKKGATESITIKGDDAGLEEGMLALRKGALVTELNLILEADEQRWQFTLKGESLHFAGLRTPPTGPVESMEDMEGAVLEKAYLCEKAFQVMDQLFRQFITVRVSEDWPKKMVPSIRKWMHS
jgi:hypothetical protein